MHTHDAAVDLFAVKPSDRGLRLFVGRHFQKSVTSRAAGSAIDNELHVSNLAMSREGFAHILRIGTERQIADVNAHGFRSV